MADFTQRSMQDGDHVMVPEFTLTVTRGPDKGRTLTVKDGRATVGTHESNELRLTDPTVSRFHCEILLTEAGVRVRDLGSRNGTHLDGVTVFAALLQGNSLLALGDSQVRFQVGDRAARIPLFERNHFGLLVGQSAAMRALFSRLEQAAASSVTVLLEGETGTGKELAAESLHMESARRDGPFVVVDCGALPAAIIESELFGHEKGAFTGADRTRIGAFEAAHGGTVFLDEVGELAPELQPKLLRVLERREVQPVGSDHKKTVDVRVVAATNRSLREEVNARRFRSDLYYRLAVMHVEMPPLRQRAADLPLLLQAIGDSLGKSVPVAQLQTPQFLGELERHQWPGNIRELRNYVEASLALKRPAPLQANAAGAPTVDVDKPLNDVREQFVAYVERRYLEALLERHRNIKEAAQAAGIARGHFYRLLGRYGLR